MGNPARNRWGNVEIAAQGIHRARINPVDQMKYLSPERQRLLSELHELITGEKEIERQVEHKEKMIQARERREREWQEEWAYE